MKILTLDTETTGLDITKHEIIQLGYIMLFIDNNNNKHILEEKEYTISPVNIHNASAEALRINGYTKEKWKNSIPFNKCAEQIKSKIQECDIMLGQNLNFDLRFIKQSYYNFNLSPPVFPRYIDTKRMASVLVEKKVLKSSSMDKMCEHFNIKSDGRAHTALVDCHRTIKVWEKLVNENIDFQFYEFK